MVLETKPSDRKEPGCLCVFQSRSWQSGICTLGGPQEPGVPVFSERKVLSGGQGDKEEQGAELSCESQKSTVVSKECGVCGLYDQSVIKKKKKEKTTVLALHDLFRWLVHLGFLSHMPPLTTIAALCSFLQVGMFTHQEKSISSVCEYALDSASPVTTVSRF